jgi:hypothetical protein
MGGRRDVVLWAAQQAQPRHPARIPNVRPERRSASDADHGALLDVRAGALRLVVELPDVVAGRLACRVPAWLRAEPHWPQDRLWQTPALCTQAADQFVERSSDEALAHRFRVDRDAREGLDVLRLLQWPVSMPEWQGVSVQR